MATDTARVLVHPVPSLGQRVFPVAAVGLAVGLARYACEFVAPEYAMWFGVYYVMPVVILIVGVRRAWGPIGWRAMAGTMLCVALIAWGIPNTIAYTTGQFLEWNHGRFFYGGEGAEGNRAAPIAATTLGKIGWGVAQGFLTSLAGTVWCVVFGTVFVWVPRRTLR